MPRIKLVLAAIAFMAAVVIVPVNAQGFRQSRVGQIWGSFVHWPEVGPGQLYTGLVTINIDGTFRAGGVHGVWERTGFRTVNFTGLILQSDAAGNSVLERHRCYFEYSPDFNSYKGREFGETVTCPTPVTCPNPLDPSIKWTPAAWTGSTGVPVTGARIEVVAPGPLK